MAAVALSKMLIARSEEANMAQMSTSNTNMITKTFSKCSLVCSYPLPSSAAPAPAPASAQGGRTRNDETIGKLENWLI
jgi:hypothetical protein